LLVKCSPLEEEKKIDQEYALRHGPAICDINGTQEHSCRSIFVFVLVFQYSSHVD